MNHSEALDILTAWIVAPGPGDAGSPEQKAAAEEHIACCVECWQELFNIGTALRAVTPETGERMRALFGCEPIVEQLYKVVAIDAVEMARRFPRVSAHLARCVSCQEILTDLEAVSLVEPLPAAASWRDIVGSGGEHIRELVGDVVFRLRQGMIAGRTWPDGLVMVPIGAAAGTMRGGGSHRGGDDEPPAPTEAPGHGFRLDLDTIDLGVDLLIESHETDSVRLEVQVLRGERPVSVALRRMEGDQEQLVAVQDAAPSKKFVASLQPGAYHLEVRDHPAALRRRIRLLLERG